MPQFKVAAIVIARGGSYRLPNKNLLAFHGQPLVVHKVQQLLCCQHVDVVVVGSDSPAILQVAMQAGARTRLRAPEFCDEQSRSWNEVIVDMVSGVNAEIILWAHCTNPNIQPRTYDRAIELFQSTDGDSVVGVTNIQTHVWWDNKPLNFDPYAEVHQVAATLHTISLQHGGIFVANRANMLQWKYVYGCHPELMHVDADEAIDIDTDRDLMRARAMYPYVAAGCQSVQKLLT